MKAVMFVPHADGASVEVRDVPKPVPAPGEALIRVVAAGLNRGELATRSKLVSGVPQPNGIEFAGEVVELGENVSTVKVGDRVMGHWRAGQAEFVAADERLLVKIPPRLSWIEAAAWLNVFTTAHDAIVSNAKLAANEAILVNAASSGIGIAALQIARLYGARPIVGSSRSPNKLELLGAHGMEIGIDATSDRYVAAVKAATGGNGADVLIDSVGANILNRNLDCLALGGRMVSVGRLATESGDINLDLLALKRITLIGVTFRTRTLEQRIACVRRCAEDLWDALADGRLQPVVHGTFRMQDIAEAHAAMEKNQHVGKLVLEIAS